MFLILNSMSKNVTHTRNDSVSGMVRWLSFRFQGVTGHRVTVAATGFLPSPLPGRGGDGTG